VPLIAGKLTVSAAKSQRAKQPGGVLVIDENSGSVVDLPSALVLVASCETVLGKCNNLDNVEMIMMHTKPSLVIVEVVDFRRKAVPAETANYISAFKTKAEGLGYTMFIHSQCQTQFGSPLPRPGLWMIAAIGTAPSPPLWKVAFRQGMHLQGGASLPTSSFMDSADASEKTVDEANRPGAIRRQDLSSDPKKYEYEHASTFREKGFEYPPTISTLESLLGAKKLGAVQNTLSIRQQEMVFFLEHRVPHLPDEQVYDLQQRLEHSSILEQHQTGPDGLLPTPWCSAMYASVLWARGRGRQLSKEEVFRLTNGLDLDVTGVCGQLPDDAQWDVLSSMMSGLVLAAIWRTALTIGFKSQ
jgi:hypothetical protein